MILYISTHPSVPYLFYPSTSKETPAVESFEHMGVRVSHSSDLEVVDITGSRITFDNGSWCDVMMEAVVSNGTGTISIGGTVTRNP